MKKESYVDMYKQEAEKLDGKYLDYFLDALGYIDTKSLKTSDRQTIIQDLIEILRIAQDKNKDISDVIDSPIAKYIDTSIEALNGNTKEDKFFSFLLKLSIAVIAILLINYIKSLNNIDQDIIKDPNKIILNINNIISITVAVIGINLVMGRILKVKNNILKLAYYLLTILNVVLISLIILGFMDKIGLNAEYIQVSKVSYFISLALSILLMCLSSKKLK